MTASRQAAKSRQKVRVLVIQMARLGDTLQSLMALRAAKQLYPQLEIHFLARESFAAAARRVPWIEDVVTLPTEALLGPVVRGEKSRTEALGDVARWVAPLVRQAWDFVVNWSYSESSSFLTGLLPAHVKLGFSRRADSTLLATDGWSHYIQAVVQARVDQNIHLTDILTTQLLTALQIHVGDPADEGEAPVTSKGFFTLSLRERDAELGDPARKWVGIQLGAGQDAKTWDPESWAQLSAYLLQRNPECGIVLLGGKEDAERERAYRKELARTIGDEAAAAVVSRVGKSDFDRWASLVGRCQWLLAGDTAAIHLASVLGTRVLNVSIGPVRWTETGPYGNGHYVVSSAVPCAGCADGAAEPAKHTCREDVTPEAVYAAWSYASGEWAHRRQPGIESHFEQLGWRKELDTVRVHRSRIRGTGDGGGVVYEPMIRRPQPLGDWNAQVMGHIARAWYCGWVPPIGQELERGTIGPALVQSLRQLDESASVLIKICDEARRTATTLSLKGKSLRSEKVMDLSDRDALNELGKKMAELDVLLDRLCAAQPALAGFTHMSKVLMHNLRGTQLADLGRQSADCYRQLSQGAAIYRDWCRFTLDLARPMAVKGASVVALERGP
jgi:ADP-heptose:LPS heptosyltransferase